MNIKEQKPWIAIIWFFAWGVFQAYAVGAVIKGTWVRPEAFPEEAYTTLMYPDMLFIPIYFSAAYLLFKQNRLGKILGLIAGGAMIYALLYLLALSKLKGAINLSFDSLFLTMNILAIFQIIKMNLPAASCGVSGHDIIAPPLMGGDRGEGEVSGDPDHHPHLTSPIKGEEPIG
jgi:hypothetical protein